MTFHRLTGYVMKSHVNLSLLTVLLPFFLTGCGDEVRPSIAADAPLSTMFVSDGFTISDKPASSIYFGKDDENYCDLTVPKENFNTGFSIQSQSKSDLSINVSCTWDKKNYVLSAKHPTYISLDVASVTTDKADVNVSLKVIDTASLSEFIEFKNVSLKIVNPDDLKKLLN